jgi:thymidylate synthase
MFGSKLMESQYLSILRSLFSEPLQPNRTGVRSRGLPGQHMSFPVWQERMPLLTTKKVFWRGVVAELLWFLSGDTNAKTLQDQQVHIWDEWAAADGSLGPVYGAQWAAQLPGLLEAFNRDPYDRGLIVDCWQLKDLPHMRLRPCHMTWQLVFRQNRLHLNVFQRSADWFLGVPFNVASYALLLVLLGRHLDKPVGTLSFLFGDAHLYENHWQAASEQLSRHIIHAWDGPSLVFEQGAPTDIFQVRAHHMRLENYEHHPAIPAPVAV